MVDGLRAPMMLRSILRTALLAAIVGTAGSHLARADIYTWADASGAINVSNLNPPEGVRVISVAHATPAATAARENAAREAAQRAETQALEERVRQLESEAEARRQLPPPVVYPVSAAPPPVPYWTGRAPASVQYTVYSSAPAYTQSCDPGWLDCGLGLFPGFYPTSVVFVRAPGFRRFPAGPMRHRFGAPQPVHSFGHFGRG